MSEKWKKFLQAAAIRALRTFCQAIVASIGTAVMFQDVNWLAVLSASGMAALLSVLTSFITGLPETETN